MTTPPLIMRVVSAVLTRPLPGSTDREMLVGLRRPDQLRPSLWECPGGKVERCMTDGQVFVEPDKVALKREIREELGVEVDVGDFIAATQVHLNTLIDLRFYEVTLTDPDQVPRALDHVWLRWVTPAFAVEHLPCAPSMYGAYRRLKYWLSRPLGVDQRTAIETDPRHGQAAGAIPVDDDDTLLFGELAIGDHFIARPKAGDNHGHGGHRGTSRLFTRTGLDEALSWGGTRSTLPFGMPVLRVTAE